MNSINVKLLIFKKNEVKLEGQRINDVYIIDLNFSRNENIYLVAKKKHSNLVMA